MSTDVGRYFVIDKTGSLTDLVARAYHPIMAALVGTEADLPKSCDGDAFVLRDWFQERGFRWGVDFYIRKLTSDETKRAGSHS